MSVFHLVVPPNRRGRDFVVGDLHGYLVALQDSLARARFHPGRDRLFSTGDLIDRGPDSPGCAALLGEPWFYAVRGNHEDMLLRVLDGEILLLDVWRQNGGDWALDDREPNAAGRSAGALCARMPWAITVEHRSGRRFGICHAQCPVTDWGDIAWRGSRADAEAAAARCCGHASRIRRARTCPPVAGVDCTIHGHTVVSCPAASAPTRCSSTPASTGRAGTLTLLESRRGLRAPITAPFAPALHEVLPACPRGTGCSSAFRSSRGAATASSPASSWSS
jgi:serine/threonine protein phosphatase 1